MGVGKIHNALWFVSNLGFGRKFTFNSQLLEVFFFFFNWPGNISQECNLTEGSKQ